MEFEAELKEVHAAREAAEEAREKRRLARVAAFLGSNCKCFLARRQHPHY
jgi:hypothetical protein